MFNVNDILQAGGLLAVAAIIFAESGLLLGFFLPGDTLLLAAGLFASQNKLPLGWLLVVATSAAIIGYQIGYRIGGKAGPRVFKRKNGILFREDYIERTRNFLQKYGPITIVIARFIAHVRTFVPVIAGAGQMNRRTFLIYNLLGAVLWCSSVTLLGYLLGSTVPDIDRYFLPLILAALVIIYVVVIWQLAKDPARRASLKKRHQRRLGLFFPPQTIRRFSRYTIKLSEYLTLAEAA